MSSLEQIEKIVAKIKSGDATPQEEAAFVEFYKKMQELRNEVKNEFDLQSKRKELSQNQDGK